MTTRIVAFACGLLLSVGSLPKKIYSVSTGGALAMHDPTYKDSLPLITIRSPSVSDTTYPQDKLSDLIKAKIKNREKFFGIEISARSTATLNYEIFKVLPLFTSIVWVGDVYANMEPISETPAIKCANILKLSGIVLPHITCYNMTTEKLNEFPLNEFKNVLILRGDNVNENQKYKHAAELVRDIRKRRKDDICIAVGGYPEVHPTASSKEEDLRYLKEKVNNGADLIITQICFSAELIVNFIEDCRQMGINIPIIPGIYIPKNFQSLELMCNLTQVFPPKEQMTEYKRLQNDESGFQEYAVNNARTLVRELLESDVGIYGVQFFTLNHFESVSKIVKDFI